MAKAIDIGTGPIQDAVLPLMADAIARAEKDAKALIEKIATELASFDYDLEKYAPYPKASIGRPAYMVAINRRNLAQSLTRYSETLNEGHRYKHNAPNYREMSDEGCARFIENAKTFAAFQYQQFIFKLVGKIGTVATATLDGNHVWSYSVLTIAREDGSRENWKTQQIVNVSKLGTLFNQWPTRKVK